MNSLTDHGTYRLTYTPPASDGSEYYPNISIEMSMSGDADVNQMLRFYEAFLAGAGFILKGDLQVAEPAPLFQMTAQGSQATDFIPFSELGDDVISLEVK